MEKVKIGIIQTSCTANKEANINKAIGQIKKLASEGAQIICLQELFSTLYFCDIENHDNFALAETIPGPSTDIFSKVAAENKVVLIVSLFEKRTAGLYHNTAAVIDADGSILGIYRKSHIPDDPGFYEKFYFAPGDTGYKAFDTKYGRIGVLICWDQWYPEAARITSLMGAKVLFYPTAIGWELDTSAEINNEQYQAWQTIQRSHAIANGVHVVSVNRVGTESGTKFWGGSFVANPFGSLLYLGPHDKEESKVVEIDLDATENYRRVWPFLRDRRIDNYAPIINRFID
ncbi:MAG TPA: carbon-nitrogen hydrolase [Bacteroidales bacterium]|nr:carbon-nitrogen hydrolase [Bacteroidales bacterium]